jgi:RNA-directed DNA polymerase
VASETRGIAQGGVTSEQIEAVGVDGQLTRLREELQAKNYRCMSRVSSLMIPKPGDGERPLGIPTL